MTTAHRVDEIVPSGIRALMMMAAQAERRGASVIHMEVGQPYFDTPAHIRSAVAERLGSHLPGYTPNIGLLSLREAVARRVAERNSISVSVDNVCITSGAVMGVALAVQALVNPTDEVLVPDPGWPNYRSAVTVAGGTAVSYALEASRGFSIDVSALERLITDRTKLIVVNSPSNPTGAVFDAQAMRDLSDLAEQRGIYLLSDEIYEDLVFEGRHHSIVQFGLTDHVLMLSGVSKSYAMTGWRLGWLVAGEPVIQAAAKLVEPLTSCPVTVSQVAAEVALTGPQDCVESMRGSYAQTLRVVVDLLGPTGLLAVEPQGAFYVLVDISSSGRSSAEFAESLLAAQGVAVAPGSTFGPLSDRYVRLSTALPADAAAEGCRRILAHLDDLRRSA
ncbi:pyridoxal phosphate-dependent aminotransferase [Leekyejoonella antrihumi]|uniref:Aminotransferase n=1 Tax=Leekyejoonella antrihumi TaxID=1660198 RepID=A0A563E1H1_9MICO|nr:pyridoxal phosphate-dependent aminotransferase [Leekyejoonella antrihumi]TWP36051.1 pyridoxal phosphate-dependent aminotransferase [Leekyejoonella antrihumi]